MKAGKINISPELLLKWLDYNDGGRIRDINLDMSFAGGVIIVVIEHPDMPEIRDGERLPVVTPLYITTTDALGHSVTIRERIGV